MTRTSVAWIRKINRSTDWGSYRNMLLDENIDLEVTQPVLCKFGCGGLGRFRLVQFGLDISVTR